MTRSAASRGELSAASRSDADLFAAMADGDVGALGTLFDRYHDDVHRFIRRACPSGADVDDVVQETFLTALRASSGYDGREVARPFLIGVAAQLLRRRRRTFARLGRMLKMIGRASVEPIRSPQDNAESSQEARRLHDAIGRLSDDRRIVLVMVELNGMSGVDIAAALSLPVGTVWRRLHEARAELRVTLERGRI